jgi:cobalt-zinc-cadmium efflux system outer membrane protein
MTARVRYAPFAALVVLPVLAGMPASADTHTRHEHQPLVTDAALTLEMAVDAAMSAYPEAQILAARQNQAETWAKRGRSLLQERPALMLRYQSDRWGDDAGLDEYEAGIELPLWSWGGRRAVGAYAEAMTTESTAAVSALRWEIAGAVREALWNVALAENARELAAQALQTSTRLVGAVERRFELGDVAERDVLLARSSHLEHETALIDANAAVLDAQRMYRTLTGLDRRPDFAAESLSAVDGIDGTHPALAFADRAVERAEADVEVARQTAGAGTSVLVGTRRERPAFGDAFDDSIGVSVTVPFGGGAHRDTEIAAAARTAAVARAARSRQYRELTLAMHEAAHGLAVARDNLAAASQRSEIAERHEAMGELAYEKGEIELLDLLRIRETAIEARRQLARLQIETKRQTALYNQAVGEMP